MRIPRKQRSDKNVQRHLFCALLMYHAHIYQKKEIYKLNSDSKETEE